MQAPTPGKPDYTALSFPPPPADRPTVILNMVSSADGRAVIEGTERGLGSPTDQRLMRELRVHADVVLNGAGTLRASGTSSRTGDASLGEPVEYGEPLLALHRPAEHVAAQHQPGRFEAAASQSSHVHSPRPSALSLSTISLTRWL